MNNSLGWLYHLRPADFIGDKLIPLNRQKVLYPSLFEKYSEIYVGREQVTERLIPILDCIWNDVIHLTNIPPSDIYRALKEAGLEQIPSRTWLKIPAEVACESPTVVYSCRTTSPDRLHIPADEVSIFDSRIFGAGRVDQRTKEYYKKQFSSGNRILLFQGIAHFLLLGEIDVARCSTVGWDNS